MSRGKVATGKAIAFRLPLAEDAVFRAKAKAAGLSPGAMAKKFAIGGLKDDI